MESDPKMAPIIITAHQEVRLRETLDKMEDFNVHVSTLGIMNDTSFVSLSKGHHVGIKRVLSPIYAKNK